MGEGDDLVFSSPSLFGSLLRDFRTLLRCQGFGSRLPALLPAATIGFGLRVGLVVAFLTRSDTSNTDCRADYVGWSLLSVGLSLIHI